ncbi:hypothetical protein ATANTOWER_008465, partial [Ataeniobius toweri]|nr:hypothetical protein [Ataeniobius toweri]
PNGIKTVNSLFTLLDSYHKTAMDFTLVIFVPEQKKRRCFLKMDPKGSRYKQSRRGPRTKP